MALKVREYWFGGVMTLVVVLFLLFVVIVAVAPHNDMKMRGFAPCTYQMAEELNASASGKKIWEVMSAVGGGYLCYAGVIRRGVSLWMERKQSTPWANYMFEPETYTATAEESEPLSEDLLNANLLDDNDEDKTFLGNNDIKENVDD